MSKIKNNKPNRIQNQIHVQHKQSQSKYNRKIKLRLAKENLLDEREISDLFQAKSFKRNTKTVDPCLLIRLQIDEFPTNPDKIISKRQNRKNNLPRKFH